MKFVFNKKYSKLTCWCCQMVEFGCISPHVSKGGTHNVECTALTYVRACATILNTHK